MSLIRFGCSILLLISLSACGARIPADELASELQTVSSWAATARMTGEAWMNSAVPKAYATRTLREAQQTIHEEIDTIRKLSSASMPDTSAALLERLQALERVAGQMATAVEQEDRAALTEQLKQLSAEEQKIKSFKESGGVQR
jgi:hypothetical protein